MNLRRPVLRAIAPRRPGLWRIIIGTGWLLLLAIVTAAVSILRGDQ